MPRSSSSAPDRLLDATIVSLRRHGMHGSALKDLASAAQVPIGSLYFHFPGGKDELVVAAIQRAGREVDEIVSAIFALATSTRAAVTTYVTALANLMGSSSHVDGCPIATTALEVGAQHDALAAAADAVFTSWTQHVEDKLVADGHPEPDATATMIVAAIEGALLLSRVHRDTGPLTAVGNAIDRALADAGLR